MVARCRSQNWSNSGARSEARFHSQSVLGVFCQFLRCGRLLRGPERPSCCPIDGTDLCGALVRVLGVFSLRLVGMRCRWCGIQVTNTRNSPRNSYVIDLGVVFGASSTTVHCQLTTNEDMDIPDHSGRCPVESGRVCKVCRLSLELAGSHCMLCEIATRLRGAAAPSSTYPTIHRCTWSGPRNHTLRGTHSRAVPTCCRPRRPLCLS